MITNFDLKMWKLGSVKTPNTYALHSQSPKYPLGKTYWKVKPHVERNLPLVYNVRW